MAPRSSTYKTLSVKKKLEILRQADEMNSDRKVAKLHQIDPKSLRTWRKQKEKLVQLHFTEKGNTRKALPKTVSTHRFPVMETLLSSWILEARSLGYAVSMKSMCQMALNFLDDLNIPHENFKASTGWAKRFIDRQGLSLRRVSTLNQHNPKDITQKVIRFIVYMRGVLERHSGPKVWACDETPVFYDLINKSTYDKKGKKEIKIRTTGADKKMVTVIPVASSDGDKKPITIIFKGKGKGKEDKNLVNRDDCTVLFSDNGWLQTSTSVEFLHSNFTREDSSEEILVWDSYRCHYITEEIKNALKELNLVNVIIPGGCTRVIQTCDVVWNSPLKAHLRTLWDDWMQNGEKSFTKNGNMRSISKTQLVDNIVQAWDMISKDVIIKSFRICGQVKDVRPDEILCMKQGKPCEEGLGKLQELLAFPTHQVDLDRLEILPEGIVNEVVDLDYNEEMFEEENALGDL